MEPDREGLSAPSSYFEDVATNKRHGISLDKNECPDDLDDHIKNRIINSLAKESWNKYPAPNHKEIEMLIGRCVGEEPQKIVASSGSVTLITTLISYYALNGYEIVIASPSFAFYEYHCKTYNIGYKIWPLNKSLEYDPDLLPVLKSKSMVIFASPNNPVGNVLPEPIMESLLSRFPETVFIADEVYHDYGGYTFAGLLNRYNNLLIIRSFSKTFSAAGLRLGYLLANEKEAVQIRSLVLPFSINYLTLNFAKAVLQDEGTIASFKQKIRKIVVEREKLYNELAKPVYKEFLCTKKSYGNFLLIKFCNEKLHQVCLKHMETANIKVHNASNLPLIENSIRVSIGSQIENAFFIDSLRKALGM